MRPRDRAVALGVSLYALACAAAAGLAAALSAGPAPAQVRISTLPSAAALTGSELLPIVQAGANATTTPAGLLTYIQGHISVTGASIYGTPTAGHCAAWYSATQIEDAGAACGSGSGGITALTGDVTASGSGSVAASVAKIAGVAVGTPTGTGNVVFSTSPTLVTPALGTPSALTLTNATGLPLATGVTGTLPAGDLSGSYTGITGVGTLSAGSIPSSLVTGLGTFAAQNYATPPAIGATTPNTGKFSALTDTAMTGGPYCVSETSGVLSSTGSACGSGGSTSPGGSSGNIQYNSSGSFAGGNLSGDCTTSTLAITCTKTNGVAFATTATTAGLLPANNLSDVASVSTALTNLGVTSVGTASSTNGVTLGMMAQAPANTIRSNPTGSTANVQDQAVPSCSGTGNYLQYVSGTGLRCVAPAAAVSLANNGSNPGTTTSTSAVMAGIAGAHCTSSSGSACFATYPGFTPGATGRLLVTITGVAGNSANSDKITLQMAYGTGTAPNNAAAATGTTCGQPQTMVSYGADTTGFSATCIVTGLTVSTAYWFDLQFNAVTAGTAALTSLGFAAVEF